MNGGMFDLRLAVGWERITNGMNCKILEDTEPLGGARFGWENKLDCAWRMAAPSFPEAKEQLETGEDGHG